LAYVLGIWWWVLIRLKRFPPNFETSVDFNFEEEFGNAVIGLVLELQGFKVDLFAIKFLSMFWAGFSLVSFCGYTISNENYLLHHWCCVR
jgi:hypothetical protein